MYSRAIVMEEAKMGMLAKVRQSKAWSFVQLRKLLCRLEMRIFETVASVCVPAWPLLVISFSEPFTGSDSSMPSRRSLAIRSSSILSAPNRRYTVPIQMSSKQAVTPLIASNTTQLVEYPAVEVRSETKSGAKSLVSRSIRRLRCNDSRGRGPCISIVLLCIKAARHCPHMMALSLERRAWDPAEMVVTQSRSTATEMPMLLKLWGRPAGEHIRTARFVSAHRGETRNANGEPDLLRSH